LKSQPEEVGKEMAYWIGRTHEPFQIPKDRNHPKKNFPGKFHGEDRSKGGEGLVPGRLNVNSDLSGKICFRDPTEKSQWKEEHCLRILNSVGTGVSAIEERS